MTIKTCPNCSNGQLLSFKSEDKFYDNVYYYCPRFECNYSEFYGQKYYAGYFHFKSYRVLKNKMIITWLNLVILCR